MIPCDLHVCEFCSDLTHKYLDIRIGEHGDSTYGDKSW